MLTTHCPSSSIPTADVDVSGEDGGRFQHVIVMRHGDRIDNFEPMWTANAERPWDPPLVVAGRSAREGSSGKATLGSRCTASLSPPSSGASRPLMRRSSLSVLWMAMITAVMSLIGLVPTESTSNPPKSRETIRMPPKDGNWGFNIPELESMLPAGTVDRSVERLYKEVPHWEETVLGARSRYEQVILGLADKYPSENLLHVTHGARAGVSVSAFMTDATVYEVEYCAHSDLRRSVSLEDEESIIHGEFEFFTKPAQTHQILAQWLCL